MLTNSLHYPLEHSTTALNLLFLAISTSETTIVRYQYDAKEENIPTFQETIR